MVDRDACVCGYVVERSDDPDSSFAECVRLLRSGSHVDIRTINLQSHSASPSSPCRNRLDARDDRGRRAEGDAFLTFYRCNTGLERSVALSRHGFSRHAWWYDPKPSYPDFSPLYRFGVSQQRYAPQRSTTLITFGKRNA